MICQERINIVTITIAMMRRLPTTEDKMSVAACWAPSTSFSRLTSAPVWVQKKKASGIRSTWE